MIVSFRHRFVFVAIPKTASQSLRRSLRTVMAPNDWEQCTLFQQRAFPVPQLAALGHGHIEWGQVAPFLLGKWDDFISFAVVRCPYERFASLARFALGNPGQADDIGPALLKALLADPARSSHVLLRPQHRFICDDIGAIRISLVLRHERLTPDMADLSARLRLSLPPLGVVNESPASQMPIYDDELRAMVRERYAEDFRLFGYDPERAVC